MNMRNIFKLCVAWLLFLLSIQELPAIAPMSNFPPPRRSSVVVTGSVTFNVSGLVDGDKANITIGSNEYLDLLTIESNGTYTFNNVPAGKHFVKIESSGYIVSDPLEVIVGTDGSLTPPTTLKFSVTQKVDGANDGNFHFVWEEDGSVTGYTTSAHVNTPAQVEFLGKMIVPADVPSQQLLLANYQILLSDEELPWTEEYAYRLLMTMKMFQFPTKDAFESGEGVIKITLADEYLPDDIEIRVVDQNKEVRISKVAFYYANPYYVRLDGVKGRFFSKRLHHALTELVTDYGRDINTANDILMRCFGCRITDLDYQTITAGITNESDIDFQMFVPSEIVAIINMLEELPEGYHKTEHLKYLLRRRNDRPHPIYPDAAAVSWPVEDGYIEFMEKAFGGNNQQFDTQRLILHEKTHFLWHFVFNDEIKKEWIKIGKWYEDPNSPSGWLTEDQTGFVSQYSHDVNPDEDMAESVAFYLKDPEWLNSRNPQKYEFLRDYIMHGTRYITQIRPDLTFEVFNLWPDYDYPGKIIKMELNMVGEATEDKQLKIDIWLNHVEGCMDGASLAHTRIFSPNFYDQNGKKCGHYVENWFSPVDGDDHHLATTIGIHKNMKAGEWTSWGISLHDDNGNARYNSNIADYIWKLYVDNSDEDLFSPEYVPNSLRYELTEIDGDGDAKGHKVQRLRSIYQGFDDRAITGTYMGFARGDEEYTWASWGKPFDDPEMSGWMYADMIIHPYFPSGKYYASSISASDEVGNGFFIRFPEDEPIKSIDIQTPHPDSTSPELDLNRISVYAEPTNPEAPNGETIVTLSFFTRDDISGLDYGDIILRDPQGARFNFNFWAVPGHNYYDGDPTEWAHHVSTTILPVGSAPGIWGVEALQVIDRAGNERTYSFIETLIFEPDDDESKYILFAEMTGDNWLMIHLDSSEGSEFGYEYRIIHEGTGQEIAGTEIGGSDEAPAMKRIKGHNQTEVDVTSLPDGDLVVITNIFNSEGQIETSKSTRVTKSHTTGTYNPTIDYKITLCGHEVRIYSPCRSQITVSTIDGRSFLKELYEGLNTFTLPQPGFYIVGNQKVYVK